MLGLCVLSVLSDMSALSVLSAPDQTVSYSVRYLCRYKAAGAAKKTIRNVVTLAPAHIVVAMQS